VPYARSGPRATEYAAPGAGGDRAASCLICFPLPPRGSPVGIRGLRRRAASGPRLYRNAVARILTAVGTDTTCPRTTRTRSLRWSLRWRTPSRARSHGTLAARGAIGFPSVKRRPASSPGVFFPALAVRTLQLSLRPRGAAQPSVRARRWDAMVPAHVSGTKGRTAPTTPRLRRPAS
jgi:hypothetical protein